MSPGADQDGPGCGSPTSRTRSAGDVERAAGMFAAKSFWRDLVAFTWNITTVEGPDGVADLLRETLERDRPDRLPHRRAAGRGRRRHRRPGSSSRPRSGAGAGCCGCEDDGEQGLDAAHHALRAEGPRGADADRRRPMGAEHGANRDRETWAEQREREAARARLRDPALRAGRRRRPGRHRARRAAAAARRADDRHRQARRGPATSGAAATSRCACTTRSGTTTCRTSSSRTTGRCSRPRTRSPTGSSPTPR